MEIQIYAAGKSFKKSSNEIKSLISVLNNYESSYNYCLKLAAEKYKIVPAQLQATIRLRTLQPGSALINVATEIANAVAPLAPQIFNHTWLLYKSAYDLIGIATRYFKKAEEPMKIEIKDSPGAMVNIINGDQCLTSPDVFLAASSIQKGFSQYADLVEKGKADNINIKAIDHTDYGQLEFNKQNYKDYKGYTQKHTDTNLVDLECNIIRFNKRTMKGLLEIYTGDTSISKPFIAKAGTPENYLDAFKAPLVTITAEKELEVNALGETTVILYHAVEVKTHNE